METMSQTWSDNVLMYAIGVWALVVVLGVVLGVKEKITVFRNYNDLAIVFILGYIGPVALPYLIGSLVGLVIEIKPEYQKTTLYALMAAIEIPIIFWFIIRAYKDNNSVWKTALALVTKTTLAVLFLLNLWSFVSPAGETAAKRAKVRRSALAWLLMLTPLIYALVRDHEGFFDPGRALRKKGYQV